MALQSLAFSFVHNLIVVQRYEKSMGNPVRYGLKHSLEDFFKTI